MIFDCVQNIMFIHVPMQSSMIVKFILKLDMLYLNVFLSCQDDDGPGVLTAFSTPTHSFAKVIMQTAGELDYSTIFDEASLLYTPMAFILFFSFVVLMPILFSNLLVRIIYFM